MIDDGDWECSGRDLGGFVAYEGVTGDATIAIDRGAATTGFCAELPAYTARVQIVPAQAPRRRSVSPRNPPARKAAIRRRRRAAASAGRRRPPPRDRAPR